VNGEQNNQLRLEVRTVGVPVLMIYFFSVGIVVRPFFRSCAGNEVANV
jgi:hypothetical protein